MDTHDDDYAEWLETQRELERAEHEERMNKVNKTTGRAPADFLYDPLARKGFE